jgi:threonine synthase
VRLTSTSGRAPAVGFREAILQGLAPDGGLYLPTDLPRISPADLTAWRALPFGSLAVRLSERLLADEFPVPVLARLVGEALDFPAPTVRLDDRLSMLELFHGPTLAFKDFGARFLGRFFGQMLRERGDHATILVATSGDTGSAVARGFAGVPGVRVVVLYPSGRVSPFQEAQMASIGGNVTAVRVAGVFDDCQRLVKAAFRDPSLEPLHLSSANSINIGRLLPQAFYYVASYLAVAPSVGMPVVFVVPSGNLGNLTAGVLAARMGLPVSRFVAATNANDVLPEYLTTGALRARPSVPTLSNAMDVGDPSNFARLERLHAGSAATMRTAILGERVSDVETRAAIRDAYARHDRVLDPHGAVAYGAAQRYVAAGGADRGEQVVALATAHPAKFADAIREELGFEPALPEADRGWRDWPRSAIDLPAPTPAALARLLCNLPPVPPV